MVELEDSAVPSEMAALLSELEARDARLERLTDALSRKQEEERALRTNYESMGRRTVRILASCEQLAGRRGAAEACSGKHEDAEAGDVFQSMAGDL